MKSSGKEAYVHYRLSRAEQSLQETEDLLEPEVAIGLQIG